MGEFTKEVGIFTVLLSVGLFLAGTAAAGAMAFPKQAQRLSHVLQTEGRQLRERLGEGVQQARSLFDAPGQGGGHSMSAGVGKVGAFGTAKAVRPRPSARGPAPMEYAPPRQQLYGLDGSGAVMAMAETRPGPSLSEGARSGGGSGGKAAEQDPAAPPGPDKPSATPIPGAFWLMGSGLAALFAAKGARRISDMRTLHRKQNRQ